jgi:hypothetical protein
VSLIILSIFINTVQGTFLIAPTHWSGVVDVDNNTQILWSWRSPQWLATKSSLKTYLERKRIGNLNSEISLNQRVDGSSHQVFFSSFYEPEGTHRWSEGGSSKLIFLPDDDLVKKGRILRLSLGTFQEQTVRILLNGVEIGHVEFKYGAPPVSVDFPITPSLVRSKELNQLLFQSSNPGRPSDNKANRSSDTRLLGFTFISMEWLSR